MSSFSFESLFGKDNFDLNTSSLNSSLSSNLNSSLTSNLTSSLSSNLTSNLTSNKPPPTLPFSFQIQKFLNLKQVPSILKVIINNKPIFKYLIIFKQDPKYVYFSRKKTENHLYLYIKKL